MMFTKLDRIARTATSSFETVKELLDRNIAVHVLNMGLVDNTPTGRLILHIMLSFAEFEREMIKKVLPPEKRLHVRNPGTKKAAQSRSYLGPSSRKKRCVLGRTRNQ